jgi:two-component system response regulator
MATEAGVILVVEDNPQDATMTQRALKKHNISNNIVLARDGAEALDYLYGTGAYAGRDASDLPHVVLLDLKLPKVDGMQVLKRIRSEPVTKTLPVVILTSSDEQRDLVESYELGVNSFVRKPVEFAAFTEAVSQLGLYWTLINRTPRPGKS